MAGVFKEMRGKEEMNYQGSEPKRNRTMRELGYRVHSLFAPEEGGHTTSVGFSGVNETPLLRGTVFTHGPSQAGKG